LVCDMERVSADKDHDLSTGGWGAQGSTGRKSPMLDWYDGLSTPEPTTSARRGEYARSSCLCWAPFYELQQQPLGSLIAAHLANEKYAAPQPAGTNIQTGVAGNRNRRYQSKDMKTLDTLNKTTDPTSFSS